LRPGANGPNLTAGEHNLLCPVAFAVFETEAGGRHADVAHVSARFIDIVNSRHVPIGILARDHDRYVQRAGVRAALHTIPHDVSRAVPIDVPDEDDFRRARHVEYRRQISNTESVVLTVEDNDHPRDPSNILIACTQGDDDLVLPIIVCVADATAHTGWHV
jgi:hypothetical protein